MGGIDPVSMVSSVVDRVLGAFLPDKAARDAATAQLTQTITQGEIASIQGQIDINKQEAASQSIFVAGWRPFIGWICGSALAVQFIVAPLFTWVAALAHHPVVFPELDMGSLMTLLLSMLGLGSMRTYEKVSGVKTGH